MDTIPASYKKLLFDKESHEDLTDQEQEAWEEILIRLKPPRNIDFDDPALKIAMKLHKEMEQEKKQALEKFRTQVLPKYIGTIKKDDL